MPLKSYLVIFLAGVAAGGYGAFRTLKPAAEVQVQEKWKDRVVTVTRTVEVPGGTKTTETTTTQDSSGSKSLTIAPKKPDWALGINYDTNLHYGATIDRRLMADLWLTVGVKTDKTASVGLKYEF